MSEELAFDFAQALRLRPFPAVFLQLDFPHCYELPGDAACQQSIVVGHQPEDAHHRLVGFEVFRIPVMLQLLLVQASQQAWPRHKAFERARA
jgi:hypothetical protein